MIQIIWYQLRFLVFSSFFMNNLPIINTKSKTLNILGIIRKLRFAIKCTQYTSILHDKSSILMLRNANLRNL